MKRRACKVCLCVVLASIVALAAASAESQPYLVAPKKAPFVVGLCNSFSGNSWRAQMIAEFRLEADKLKAKGILKNYFIADATGSTASQIQQIQNMVARKVDLLLIDANSLTALNPAIEAAHKAGVLIVSFDNVVDSPYALTVQVDQKEWARIGAEWLVKKLNGQGSIIVLNGLAGTPANDERWSGAKSVFDRYPNIKILAMVNADWDQAKGQQDVANLLPSFSKIDGVWSQGGAMTLGAIYAFQAAGRALVPMSGEGNNGLLKIWKQNLANGFDSIAPSSGPTISAEVLDFAIEVLKGKSVPKDNQLPALVITGANLDQYVRPELSDALWLPTNLDAEQLRILFK
jgi:ribose transport system substrate-binding protein